jgi:hypothetical protein
MAAKLLKIGTLGLFTLSALALGQTASLAKPVGDLIAKPVGDRITVAAGDSESSDAMKAGTKKNGRSQSESVQGENKNGAVATDMQTKHKKSHIQRDTDPAKNGKSQSEGVNGENKNGQPQ